MHKYGISQTDIDNNFKDSTLTGVTRAAIKMHIKKKGEGWSKCCPPKGNKRDIIQQIKIYWKHGQRPFPPGKSPEERRGKERHIDWDAIERDRKSLRRRVSGEGSAWVIGPRQTGAPRRTRSRSPPRRQSRPRSRSPKRGVTFKDDSDCPQSRRPVTLNRRRRNFCRDVGMKKDKYEYYRTQKYYGCCRKKGKKEKKGRIPSKSDMKEMFKKDLEKIAKKVGLKQQGIGWKKCCGGSTKKHIIKALDKFR